MQGFCHYRQKGGLTLKHYFLILIAALLYAQAASAGMPGANVVAYCHLGRPDHCDVEDEHPARRSLRPSGRS